MAAEFCDTVERLPDGPREISLDIDASASCPAWLSRRFGKTAMPS